MDHYQILGVKPGASKREITEAFRKKAKSCHPDLHPNDPAAEKRFKQLNDAYQNLLRADSDLSSSKAAYTASANFNYPRRVNSVKEITLTISEAMNGVHYRIDDADGLCDTCRGSGHVKIKHPISCPYCGGSGNSVNRNAGPLEIQIVCSNCEGSGKTTRQKCIECHGFGTKAGAGLVIDLPAGCLPGESFIVENGFSNKENNIVGDLELLIALKPDPRFRVHGVDIEMQIKLEVWEAVLGAKKRIVGPDGTRLGVDIPSGTSHGRRIRLKGMGMRKNTEDTEKGDLVLVTAIQIPTETAKIKEAYERLRDDLT